MTLLENAVQQKGVDHKQDADQRLPQFDWRVFVIVTAARAGFAIVVMVSVVVPGVAVRLVSAEERGDLHASKG